MQHKDVVAITFTEVFHFHKPGLLTTIQDLGRTGFQQYGVPVSGAMDTYALQMANILAGNKRHAACLEITLIGPEMEVLAPVIIAITGGDLQPMVNGSRVSMWKSLYLQKGDCITFGKPISGMRSYLAVKGGIIGEKYFGSRAVDLASGFGQKLKKNDRISACCRTSKITRHIGLLPKYIPVYGHTAVLHVAEGPHEDYFTAQDRNAFYQTCFTVGANSNRMGYRLKAAGFRMTARQNIFSDAVPFGSIQIPPDGQPIILMADRQTTGGYPRIGTVMTTDISKAAQLQPNDHIYFQKTTIEKAQEQAIAMEKSLYMLDQFAQHWRGAED